MKRTPLSWDPPEVGDLAVIYNGLGHPFYVLILEIREEPWPSRSSVNRMKKLAMVQWLIDGTTGDIDVDRLKVV